VEVVELETGGIYKVEHQEDLNDEAHTGGEGDHVVHEADDEDDEDGGEDGEEVEGLAQEPEAHDAGEDTEDYGEAAQDGDRDTLELAGIGVVDDVLGLGYLEDVGVDPTGAEEGDERRSQDL